MSRLQEERRLGPLRRRDEKVEERESDRKVDEDERTLKDSKLNGTQ